MASQMEKRTNQPQAEWYWQSNSDPWSPDEKQDWKKYSDIESEIIEGVFDANDAKGLAKLDNYLIDLNSSLQISKSDHNKESNVKRVLIDRNENQGLREERFFLPQALNRPFNDDSYKGGLHLIKEWKKKAVDLTTSQIVEQAANGIINEGDLLGEHCASRWIARQLTAVQNKDGKEIYKCCIRLYTKECFLYKIINQAMIEADITKLDTLAPFCYLLFRSWLQDIKPYKAETYRGGNLNPDMVKYYQKSTGRKKCWYGFTSTSKNREKAESFGNSLFIIDMSDAIGIDISACSDFPNEEEVLLPPGTTFKIKQVQFNNTNYKNNIFLKIVNTNHALPAGSFSRL
ncbi:unnamed protein product [Didymodactylos carnosus]|uniref:NAD(P)(+)--arginine ADP-ribosyltransferase n=1 Tax=Didymodactylos carnosus TaxID=1234261 RepID=A0A8S2E4M2_9BILA|nr:unnamed protein product [Didymodactylos carnosus]CAF3914843.1 unnamed protein product [Didymodactylos carnosus]